VCTRGPDRAYIQAAYVAAHPATRAREFGNLLAIRDDFPEFVVSLDPFPADQAGVRHLGWRPSLKVGLWA